MTMTPGVHKAAFVASPRTPAQSVVCKGPDLRDSHTSSHIKMKKLAKSFMSIFFLSFIKCPTALYFAKATQKRGLRVITVTVVECIDGIDMGLGLHYSKYIEALFTTFADIRFRRRQNIWWSINLISYLVDAI